MKKQTLLFPSLCLSVGLAIAPAYAQEGRVKANVPFKFNVAGKTLPAGEYEMSTRQKEVVLRNSQGRIVAIVLGIAISRRTSDAPGHLIFHCYAGRAQCFLWQVMFPNQEAGRELSISRLEAEAAKKENAEYVELWYIVPARRPPQIRD
jgi:hypothetical protein